MSSFSAFLEYNRRISRAFDRVFFAWNDRFLRDGRTEASQHVIKLLRNNMTICDLGGGKRPEIAAATKDKMELLICGVDIDENELLQAPAGRYDTIVVTDITKAPIDTKFDLIIVFSVLEHVSDQAAAWENMTSMLVPGGQIIGFMPCKYAIFARLNKFLPESFKHWLLKTFYHTLDGVSGFPAFYDKCSPSDITYLCKKNQLEVVQLERFYSSGYFQFFIVFYILWRLWVYLAFLVDRKQFVETFFVVAKK